MKYFITSLLLLIALKVAAQSPSIKLKIIDTKKNPVFGATLKLQQKSDTNKVFYQSTDTLGLGSFKVLSKMSYKLTVSSVGFVPLTRMVVASGSTWVFELLDDNQLLAGVSIKANKPLITQEDDKTVIDAEQLASASVNAFEIIEKTPGIFIDSDGNVYLNSTTPAAIYINGREQRMGPSNVAAMLRNLPPNSIEKIEIMRTPSAKYDAATAGGAVNILLKKGVKIGLTGSVNIGANQGKLGDQSTGLNISNNTGNGKNMYLNISLQQRNNFDSLNTVRKISASTNLAQNSYTTTPSKSLYVGYGYDQDINKKWSLGLDGDLSYSPGQSLSKSVNQQINGDKILLALQNITNNNNSYFLVNQNLNLKYKIDSLGSMWIFNATFNKTASNTTQDFSTFNLFKKEDQTKVLADLFNHRTFWVGQLDFTQKFNQKLTLELGVKSTFQAFYSNALYTGNQNAVLRNNQYQYKENINAAYFNASKTMGKITLKLGARLENTRMEGHQTMPKDTVFKINRTDVFPYIFLSKGLLKIAGYELRAYLIARRAITRPSFDYLNPTIQTLDQFLYQVGNPSLRPQFTQTYEANISVDERPLFAIGKNYTSDIFSNVIYQNPNNQAIAFRTYDNLGKNEETYFRLLGGIPPTKPYFFALGAQYSLNHYTGVYDKETLDFTRGSWRFFTFHRLKLNDNTNINLNAFYSLNGQLQFYELSNFGRINLNVSHYFANKKYLISVYANDIFYSSNASFSLKQSSVVTSGNRLADTRRLGMTVRYNFGIKKRQENVNMFDVEKMGN